MEDDDAHMKNAKIDYTKDMEKEEELEILKHRDPNVHVFSLPPMSASGHKAIDFVNLVFKGTMKMTMKGEYMFIYFLKPDNTIFLISIVNKNYEKFVMPTDSSRYFSIKAMNDQKIPAWYGIAFHQRNAAFDFKKTLSNFKEQLEFEEKLKQNKEEYKPKYDFSLHTKPPEKPKENNLSKFKFGNK